MKKYLYHATDGANISGIARRGLCTGEAADIETQWPNIANRKRIYVTSDEGSAFIVADELKIEAEIIRIAEKDLPSGCKVTTDPNSRRSKTIPGMLFWKAIIGCECIPPELFERLDESGAWRKLR